MKKILTFMMVVLLTLSMLAGCGTKVAPSDTEKEPVQDDSEENIPEEKDENQIETEKAEPIYANQLKDGTYQIEVSSSSSMFRIVDAKLTVAVGEMYAVITMSGKGYEKVYMGTGEEALSAADDEFITYVEDAEGMHTYKVPVEALNKDTECAAFSKRKQSWYDRILVFKSSLIPKDAIITDAVSDGKYTSEVTLSGGSGRAKVESPADLTVENGKMTATVIWSSPHYEYMLIDGVFYYATNTNGNSTFEIPVLMDKDIETTAQTVAMSTPHEIEYTLHFDSATLKSK